jgi:hypothetical protein
MLVIYPEYEKLPAVMAMELSPVGAGKTIKRLFGCFRFFVRQNSVSIHK